jgi:hypothetical protein
MLYSHLSIIFIVLLNIFSLGEGVKVTQKIPASIQAGSSFTVDITIHKALISGFAKYETELPEGFTAIGEGVKNPSFSFADHKVKFVWASLPPEQEFRISYKVLVSPASTGIKSFGGTFAYVEKDQSQKFYLTASTISITPGSSTATAPPAPASSEKKPVSKSPEETIAKTDTKAADVPAPSSTGIIFKVQLASKQTNVGKDYFKNKFHVDNDIYIEKAEGQYKYYAGNFQLFDQAKELCNKMKQQGITDAFVVAYKNNQRISIKDALSAVK